MKPILITITCVLLFIAGFLEGRLYGIQEIQDQAIQHGYMQHNPVTGKVEWR